MPVRQLSPIVQQQQQQQATHLSVNLRLSAGSLMSRSMTELVGPSREIACRPAVVALLSADQIPALTVCRCA
jgi:hypothetical protein